MFGFGYGRGPRRGGSGFLLLFVLFIFAPELFFGLGLVYLLPIVIGGLAIATIIKAIASSATNTKQKYKEYKNEKSSFDTNLSNADITKIDKKLTNYFKNNVALPIVDDISLVTSGGKYTNIDSLFVSYKDEKVIKLGDFKQEHFEMYDRIVSLIKEFSKKPDSVIKEKVDSTNTNNKEVLSDATKYINKINELNAAIPQEEITNGLYQTCDLLKQIDLSKQSKQDEQKVKKLYDYYLPILTGILENYKNLQNQAIKGEEFKKCEAQLIKTIMLINQALKTLYEQMHEDDYLNINADMDTLQTLIKKDGFEDPFASKE